MAFGVQQIDNNFVSPTVLRATVRLHPAVVILVLILGGAVGGLWGVLLAVPVTASVKIVAGHLWRTRVLGQSWEEASQKLIDEGPMEPVRPRRRKAAGTVGSLEVVAPDEDVTLELDAVQPPQAAQPDSPTPPDSTAAN